MRLRVRRLLGVSALALLFGLPVVGCSGSGQEEEGLDVSEQDNNAAADDNSSQDNASANTNGGEEGAGDEQATADDATTQQEDGGGETAAAGDGSENDLQEIIQEMNGQPQQDTAAQPAAPANQQAAAPAAAPANETAAAAPAAPQAQPSSPLPFQPGGTPAGTGLPELGSKMAYVVEHGDTLGKISQKIYGSPNRWNELASLSGITNPSRIFPGDLIYYTLDEGAVPFAAAYESIQKAEEKVQQGDTLATIAKRVYGSTTAWRSIWRQNDKIDNPDIVPPGTAVLYIPKGAATTALLKSKVDLIKLAKTTKSNIFETSTKISVNTKSNLQDKFSDIAKTNSTILAKSQHMVQSVAKITNVSVVPTLI